MGTEVTRENVEASALQFNAALRAAIERQGFAFHYRAIVEAEKAFSPPWQSPWLFEASEFPVRVQERDTRVDCILKHKSGREYLTVEYKRVNPKFRQWLFLRAPYVRRDRSAERFLAEGLTGGVGDFVSAAAFRGRVLNDPTVTHIAFEVKTDEKGDPDTRGRGVLEEALSQACLSANGLLQRWITGRSTLPRDHYLFAIPVVVTTAKLTVARVNFSKVDLASGELSPEDLEPEEVPFVFHQYPVSLGLRHSEGTRYLSRNIAHALDREFLRTVPIVSAGGLLDFLRTFDPDLTEQVPAEPS